MRELSVPEQRYEAVRSVIADGDTVTEVAARFGVSRKTVHAWLARYEAGGLEGLGDRSHRPRSCPHQMPAAVEVALAEMRLAHPTWGPRRLAFELARSGVAPAPSESAAYRALVRLGLIDPGARRPRDRKWKRWERGVAMELWQMDVVGGFVLADGRRAKALTGIDDHSRFCVSAFLMLRESSQRVCDGLALRCSRHGVPEQILTDIQSGCAVSEPVLSAGGGGSASSGTCPPSLLDRVERPATPGLLTVLAGGAPAGGSRCPVENPATPPIQGLGIPVSECLVRIVLYRRNGCR